MLPLHHTYECMAGFLSILYAGGSISYMSGLAHLLSDFREYKPTVFVAVPLLLKTIHTSLMKKMKAVRGGGAYLAVGKALAAGFRTAFRKSGGNGLSQRSRGVRRQTARDLVRRGGAGSGHSARF